ncbi:MAG: hypothetical protein HOP12_02750 [Candidatus Eisenbacteria bacterium]|uniref:Tetratricopeptide repeat protein n=1 Tax=Eiseniibacteriota bacterium TaxID=2212470 RepID=A0A849SV58_UNCEI|nr:hypothetical protein [Candidatus Eisenbacteria bacterium]
MSHRSAEGSPDLESIHRDNLRLLHAAGVSLALGTDHPALTVIDEAERIRALGVFSDTTLLGLLAGQTAQVILPQRRVGTLTAGAEASFIVLAGNPLVDFAQIRNVSLRFKRGLRVDPPAPAPGKPSIAEAMLPALMQGKLDSALAIYDHMLVARPDSFDFGEQALNQLGFAMLSHRQTAGAVAILRKNAERFPQSANAFDSLGEALVAAGRTQDAIAAYERVLRNLAESPRGAPEYRRNLETRARAQLEQLRAATR